MEQQTDDGELVPEFLEDKLVRGHSMSRYTLPIGGEPREVIALEQMNA